MTDQTQPPNEAELARLKAVLEANGYVVEKGYWPTVPIPDKEAYRPFVNGWAIYSPWLIDPDIVSTIDELRARSAITLVSPDRLWVLKAMMRQAERLPGEVWELGVYRGGTALLLKKLVQAQRKRSRKDVPVRLFDTFGGMPQTSEARDVHNAGDFADTSLESVRRLVGSERWIDYRAGLVPETFRGLEDSRIRFAHVDLDIYDAILAACEFVYPRLSPCGVMVFDDYGFWSCPGARAAVDEFFRDRPEAPVCLPTGQALVVKLPESR